MTSRRARPETESEPRRRGLGARLRSVVFWAVELALVLPVAVGVLAWWLRPGPFWWAQIVAVVLPYAAWVLAAWTLIPLLGRRWRVAGVHALLIGTVLWRAVPLAAPPAPPDVLAGDDVLRLVTFNVPESGPSREALGDSMVAFVATADPHVLALQDAWMFAPSPTDLKDRPVQLSAVEAALAYRAPLPNGLIEIPRWRRWGTNVSVLSHDSLTVSVGEVLSVEVADGAVSLGSRTEVEWAGRRFALYNTHLRSFGKDKPWLNPAVLDGRLRDRLRAALPYFWRYREVYAARGAQADALAEVVAADSLPALVVGDLNSTPDNWSARRLRTAGAPRTDAQRARGRGWGRTYHAARPLVRIDVVYADPAFEVLAAETAAVGFSDHRPLRVWLRWRERS